MKEYFSGDLVINCGLFLHLNKYSGFGVKLSVDISETLTIWKFSLGMDETCLPLERAKFAAKNQKPMLTIARTSIECGGGAMCKHWTNDKKKYSKFRSICRNYVLLVTNERLTIFRAHTMMQWFIIRFLAISVTGWIYDDDLFPWKL